MYLHSGRNYTTGDFACRTVLPNPVQPNRTRVRAALGLKNILKIPIWAFKTNHRLLRVGPPLEDTLSIAKQQPAARLEVVRAVEAASCSSEE